MKQIIKNRMKKEMVKERVVVLKRGIPKGTMVKDLYDDGNLYYKIGGIWYPVDFNNFSHPDFCKVKIIQ